MSCNLYFQLLICNETILLKLSESCIAMKHTYYTFYYLNIFIMLKLASYRKQLMDLLSKTTY